MPPGYTSAFRPSDSRRTERHSRICIVEGGQKGPKRLNCIVIQECQYLDAIGEHDRHADSPLFVHP